ncbi:MAG TPA: hypothetical protein VF240_22410 [Pyrinomonadaceae bacterium]
MRALGSYLRISNHPFSETERTSLPKRSFTAETRIARDLMLRCTETLKSSSFAFSFSPLPADAGQQEGEPSLPRESVPNPDGDRFAYAASILEDLYALYDCVVETENVSFESWLGLAGLGARQLALTGYEHLVEETSERRGRSSVSPELCALASQISPDSLSADVSAILTQLYGMLDLLGFVESSLAADEPLKGTLPVFTLLREESRALLDLIVERTLRIEGLDPAVHEYLDGVAYAIRMELRKAFEHELVGLSSQRSAPLVFGKVENAHGLLRDCFQQSVIGVARAFDAQLDGSGLFNNFRTKLEQSLLLRQELWEVLAAVRRADQEQEPAALRNLMLRLSHFREGSLRFLMYKDWEALERFVAEATAAKSSADLQPVLHRFHAFLETLFGQVNMRAVLADHPFDPDTSQD